MWTLTMHFEEMTIQVVYAPQTAHRHKLHYVANILRSVLRETKGPILLAGDLNTDFVRPSLNKEIFEELIFQN